MTKKSRDRRKVLRFIKSHNFTKHECNGMTFYFSDMPDFNDNIDIYNLPITGFIQLNNSGYDKEK